MKLFIITPQYCDPTFDDKKEVLVRLACKFEIKILFGYNTGKEDDIDESIALLENADFVLADLSLARPSCYYEIGFAQSRNKSVYLISTIDTEIHQVRFKSKICFYKKLDDYEELINFLFSKIASIYAQSLVGAT
jgi:hypothetical protein